MLVVVHRKNRALPNNSHRNGRMQIKPITLIFLASILTGCSPGSIEVFNHKATALAYESKNPVADSDAAFDRADYRIYAAMGYARYYPGLDPDLGRKVEARFGSRTVPSTDALESEAHANAVHAAVAYARAFNLHLLDRLRSAKLARY
jgi:hypothetical protein